MKAIKKALEIGAIVLALAGCTDREPQVKTVRDFTGDSIPDVRLFENTWDNSTRIDYLFIGQKNGKYIRTRAVESDDMIYFKSDSGAVYFFDGKFFIQARK